jgi:hypothetical protein
MGFWPQRRDTKLQGHLNIHIAAINTLLAVHALAKIDIASGKTEADALRIGETL